MYFLFFTKLLPNNGKSTYYHENNIAVRVRRAQFSAHDVFSFILKLLLLDPDRQDGFYASRWCNVFYRCFGGVNNAFLCPLMRGGGRLWWVQHGTQQSVPESSAACAFPCETGRQCSSAGGILVENGNQISESQQEAEAAYRQSVCYNQTAQTGQIGTGQFGTGQTGAGQSGTGQTGTGQFGTGQTGTGQMGTGQTGTGQVGGVGTGQIGGTNQGSSSNTGGKLLSMISCAI
jgi:hypothetical protein